MARRWAIRLIIAGVVIFATIRVMGLTLPRDRLSWRDFFIMGFFNSVVPFCLIAWGQTHIESGLASILNGTTAIFAVLIAVLVFKDEKLTGRKLAGVVLASGGALVVVGPEALRNFDIRSLAQMALLGASLSYACAAV